MLLPDWVYRHLSLMSNVSMIWNNFYLWTEDLGDVSVMRPNLYEDIPKLRTRFECTAH